MSGRAHLTEALIMLRAVNRGTHTGEGIETSLSGLLESPGGK